MSTRSSIHYADDGNVHLFADCVEDYEMSGLHLDMSSAGHVAGFGPDGWAMAAHNYSFSLKARRKPVSVQVRS